MMGYTNSSLISCVKLSPNHSGQRTHTIDRITVHCVVGQCSAETIGSVFAPESRQASSNYGVGYDGKIGMYVEEKNRSWCTSSGANDQRAITIEVASDAVEPYAFNDVAYERTVELCIDICKRNGKNKVIWLGDKVKTLAYEPAENEIVLTVHRWFANKSCPGNWMYARMNDLASKVNAALNKIESHILYRVQTGAYYKKANADSQLAKVKAAGFDTYMVKAGGLYKIQVGAYSKKENADNMAAKLKAAGFDTYITTEKGEAVSSSGTAAASLAVGDKVKLDANAPVYGGTSKFASWVYSSTLYLRELNGNRAVISTQKTGAVTGAVDKKYLKKA